METGDSIKLPVSSNSENGNDLSDTCESGCEAIISDSIPLTSEVIENIDETPGAVSDGVNENMDSLMTTESEKLADSDITALQIDLEMTNSVAEVETMASISFVHAENGSLPVQSEVRFSSKNETFSSKREADASSLSGVKRPRVTVDEQQPSVHVTYTSLPKESKQKLERLLEQWSQWHSQRFSSSKDKKLVLESGEKTYFPALRIGLDNPSTVTFWVDNQTTIQSSKEFVPLDSTSVPLYDRGYSLALTSADGTSGLDGGVEKLDTSRCFNCGSYNHALRDCTKPRDNAAVNNARKELRSKRNQQANARNSTRYYQSSRGGKYDGLTPGVLDVETRRLLGLGELDPPPWLNRMREIGYPPGYLDADMEDQPSGITIFGDDETTKDENEEGEILDAGHTKPSRTMTVKFPGINAPIPENADERLWAPPSSTNSNSSRHGSHRRHIHSSENSSRGRPIEPQRWSSEHRWTTEQRWSSEQRRTRDFDDDGPPGCEPGSSPSLAHHFSRFGDIESGYYLSPRASPSTPWSSSHSRSLPDRGRRSPLVHDASPRHGYYGSWNSSPPR
ncbi:hypothetical protein ACS0TY_029235 [Phlomoides rotata]